MIGYGACISRWRSGIAFVLLMLLASCGKPEEAEYQPTFTASPKDQLKEYVVGIHPLHNPQRLLELYGPILEYINLRIPDVHFKLEASRNYGEFDKKLYAGHFDIAMPNPYQTVRSLKHGYRVFAKMGDDEEFRGIILVRKDSNMRDVSDLKGKAVSYPAKTALAATMMPQYYLHTHGINVNQDIKNLYVGSQESSILNVLRGRVAAGATWPVPWRSFIIEHPKLASQLEVKWETVSLQNNGWVARQDVPEAVVEEFKRGLLDLNNNVEGRRMLNRLQISRFESATDDTYLPVINFLTVFSKNVRPVEW